MACHQRPYQLVNSLMATSAAAITGKRDGHSVGFNLGVIALVAALLGLGVAYLISGAVGGRTAAPAPLRQLVSRTLGGTTLEIPAGWMTGDDDQSATGFARQVDLTLNLPLGPDGAMRSIDVTLTQRSRVRPSASLLDGVYLHDFLAQQLNGPPGLIGKPMASGDGFENETVWYD